MARGRIEQQIDLRVNGLTEAQQAEQVVDSLDGKRAQASVSVDASGTAEVRTLAERLEGLSTDQKRIVLNADVSGAERDIARIDRKLRDAQSMSGSEIRVQLEARDNLTRRVDEARAALRSLDGETVEVNFEAGGDLPDVLGKLPGQLGEVAGAFTGGGGIAAGAGAIALALGAAATSAADLALSAQTTADLTGASVEDASRLQAVWSRTGADVNDLNDVMLQMNGVLQQSPELARQIGVNLDDGRDIASRFVEVVQRVSASTGDAAERAQLMSQLFGEEGVRQVQALVTAIGGDLQGALDDVSDAQVIDPGEVEQARQFKQQMALVEQQFQQIAITLGQSILPLATQVAAALNADAPTGESWLEALGGPALRGLQQFAGGMALWNRSRQGAADDTKAIADAITVAGTAASDTSDDMLQLRIAELAVASAGTAVGQSALEQENAWRVYLGVVGQAIAQLGEIADAQRAAADAGFGLRDAQRDFEAQLQTSIEATSDAEATLHDWSREMDATAQAAGRVADSQVEVARETAEATGQTYDSADAQRTWNSSMITSARSAEGPLRDAIINYIAAVNGIPVETVTAILANPDYATIDAAAAAITAAAADQRANIAVTDNGTARETGDEIDREIPSQKTTSVNVTKGSGWDVFSNPFGRSVRVPVSGGGGGGGSNQPVRAVAPAAARTGVALADDADGDAEPVEGRSDGAYESLSAQPASTLTLVAPSVAPVNVSVQLQAAVIGSRFDVERAVRRSVRDGVRLAGRRDRGPS